MSHRLSVMWIDAFTQIPFSGNPCLVVLNADGLSDEQMQVIAREVNLSETAFVLSSHKAQFRARYFTPAEEIPLAGHPTLSVTRALIDSGQLEDREQKFSLELEAGVIEVEIQHTDSGSLFRMRQLTPVFGETYPVDAIAPVFGLSPDDLLADKPIQTVSTGTPQLMIPVKDLDVLRRVQLHVTPYIRLRAAGDFFSPHVFCTQGVSPSGDTFARHFGVPPDTYEDPFTGSATGGMAAYMWHYRLIDVPQFVAEQGHWMQRPGQAWVEIVGSSTSIEHVIIGGYAIRIMSGEMVI